MGPGILDRSQGRKRAAVIRIPTGGGAMRTKFTSLGGSIGICVAAVLPQTASAQWEPTKTVEFIVPAGTGAGAHQMTRVMPGIIAKHNLIKQCMVVVHKQGGAGAW